MKQVDEDTGRYFGREVVRREDRNHLIGNGHFTDDLAPPDTLYVAILRSPHAHARIRSLDTKGARKLPGVVTVFAGEDLKERLNPLPLNWVLPGMSVPEHPALAYEKARFVGDGVAVVVAESRYITRCSRPHPGRLRAASRCDGCGNGGQTRRTGATRERAE